MSNKPGDDMKQKDPASASFLVRVWREPSTESEDGQVRVRFFLRNLQTGEEFYQVDPRAIGDQLLLEDARHTQAREAEDIGGDTLARTG